MITTLKDNLNLWGFAPAKLPTKLGLAPRTAPRILANSLPKSGTHLLERLLYLLPGVSRQFSRTFSVEQAGLFERRCARLKRGQFLVSHLGYREAYLKIIEQYDLKPILLIRDPRDILLSHIHYVTRLNRSHWLHRHLAHHLTTDKERLHFCIRGNAYPHQESMAELLERYHAWMQCPGVLTIRFKDLIGADGGGSAETQRQAVDAILAFIGIRLEPEARDTLLRRIFHPRSKTFHKGQINQWMKRYDEEDKNLFKELAGDWLIKYGYEQDHNW